MHRSEEFLMSDDSDVPELDLPMPGRQKKLRLFRPRTLNQESVAKARVCCSPTCGLIVLLTSLVVAVVFLGVSYMRLLNHLEGVILLPQKLSIMEAELYQIKQRLDGMKANAAQTVEVSSDSAKLDFDQLTKQIKNITEEFQELKVGASLKSLQEKVGLLSERCANCKLPEELEKGRNNAKSEKPKAPANDKMKKKRSRNYDDDPVIFERKDKP